MIKLQKREKQYLILMGIALFIFIYLKYIMLPVLDNINKNKGDIDNYKSQLNLLQISGLKNNRLKSQVAKAKKNYNVALLNLPLLEKNPEIVYNLKPIADQNNVTLDSISLSDGILYVPNVNDLTKKNKLPIESSNLYSVNTNLNVSTSDYSNIMDFLSAVENDKRINEIANFSIQYQRQNKITGNSNDTQKQPDVTSSQSIISDTQNDNTNTQNSDNITKELPSDQTNGDQINTSSTQSTIDTEPVSANISINYFYNLTKGQKPKYDFNKGTYGKDDLFK